MKIESKTATILTLYDNQFDKAFGIYAMCAFLIVVSGMFLWEGFWLPCVLPLSEIPAGIMYLKQSRMESRISIDRASDEINLIVKGKKGRWKLDLEIE